MNKALYVRLTTNRTNAKRFLGFYLQAFRQAGPPQREDCLAQMENKRTVSFPRTQQRIASSRIEPGVSNLSITKPTLYH